MPYCLQLRLGQENKDALPNAWADSRQQPLEDLEPGYHGTMTRMQMGYIDMNGEEAHAEGGTKLKMCLLSVAPCCFEPCGAQRREEYTKSLKSMSVLLGFVQTLFLIISLGLGGFAPPSQNPMLGPPTSTLVVLGAKQGYLIQHGQVWRFFTPIILHAGIIHLLMNMICQWRFGLFLERRWGTLKFAAVYVCAGIGGNLASCLIHPNAISVGASGSLLGVMGAFIADLILRDMPKNQRIIMFIQVGFWVLVTSLLGFVPGVDSAAHLGGLLIGAGVGFMVLSDLPKVQRTRILCLAVPAVLMGIFLIVGLVCFWTVIIPTPYP